MKKIIFLSLLVALISCSKSKDHGLPYQEPVMAWDKNSEYIKSQETRTLNGETANPYLPEETYIEYSGETPVKTVTYIFWKDSLSAVRLNLLNTDQVFSDVMNGLKDKYGSNYSQHDGDIGNTFYTWKVDNMEVELENGVARIGVGYFRVFN